MAITLEDLDARLKACEASLVSQEVRLKALEADNQKVRGYITGAWNWVRSKIGNNPGVSVGVSLIIGTLSTIGAYFLSPKAAVLVPVEVPAKAAPKEPAKAVPAPQGPVTNQDRLNQLLKTLKDKETP